MIIKKIFKFFVLVLVIFIAYLGYQYIVNSIYPADLFNTVKNDIINLIQYIKENLDIPSLFNNIKEKIINLFPNK